MNIDSHADLRALRKLLVEKAAASPGNLAPMFDRMVAVMDHYELRRGRTSTATNPMTVRRLQRRVSLTIDDLYGIRNTPFRLSGLLPQPPKGSFSR